MTFLLEDISEKEDGVIIGQSYIYFKVQGFSYFITVSENTRSVFTFKTPAHFILQNMHTPCPLCQEDTRICSALKPYRNELIKELIESPSLRLPWLYRTYTFEA